MKFSRFFASAHVETFTRPARSAASRLAKTSKCHFGVLNAASSFARSFQRSSISRSFSARLKRAIETVDVFMSPKYSISSELQGAVAFDASLHRKPVHCFLGVRLTRPQDGRGEFGVVGGIGVVLGFEAEALVLLAGHAAARDV